MVVVKREEQEQRKCRIWLMATTPMGFMVTLSNQMPFDIHQVKTCNEISTNYELDKTQFLISGEDDNISNISIDS